MDNQNQKGFIDTATSIGQAAYDVTKTIARAAAGDYVGAVITAAKSPLIRKIITTVLVIILLFIFIVGDNDMEFYCRRWRIFRGTNTNFEYGITDQWRFPRRLQY